jgi:hypothetical protein
MLRKRIFIPARFSGRERSDQENLQPEKMKPHFFGGRRLCRSPEDSALIVPQTQKRKKPPRKITVGFFSEAL